MLRGLWDDIWRARRFRRQTVVNLVIRIGELEMRIVELERRLREQSGTGK